MYVAGVWNLTLFKAHLCSLPLENIFQGFHDPDDPSIVSVDAHLPSGTGRNDTHTDTLTVTLTDIRTDTLPDTQSLIHYTP